MTHSDLEEQGELLEKMADEVHRAYLATCKRLHLEVKDYNNVPYDKLPYSSKEQHRASVRAVYKFLRERAILSNYREYHDNFLNYHTQAKVILKDAITEAMQKGLTIGGLMGIIVGSGIMGIVVGLLR